MDKIETQQADVSQLTAQRDGARNAAAQHAELARDKTEELGMKNVIFHEELDR